MIYAKSSRLLINHYDTPLSDQQVIWNFQWKFELNTTLYSKVMVNTMTSKIRHFLHRKNGTEKYKCNNHVHAISYELTSNNYKSIPSCKSTVNTMPLLEYCIHQSQQSHYKFYWSAIVLQICSWTLLLSLL